MKLRLTVLPPFCVFAVFTGGTLAAGQDSPPKPPTALEVEATGDKTFYLDSRAGNSQVTIISEAPLEDFTSVCNRVAGKCNLDPQHVETLTGSFQLRVADIDTGIDLRNGHLVSADWLDSAKYPLVVVEIGRVESAEKTGPHSASLVMVGSCTLHGTTRDIRISGKMTYLDESPKTMRRVKGDLIRLRATFEIKLADYGITGPPGSGVIGLKVAETVEIRATVFGSTEQPPEELKGDAPASQEAPKRPAPKRRPPRHPPPENTPE